MASLFAKKDKNAATPAQNQAAPAQAQAPAQPQAQAPSQGAPQAPVTQQAPQANAALPGTEVNYNNII